MNIDPQLVKLLGAAQVLVFLASFISERLLESSVGSAGGTDILIAVSNHLPRIRLSNLIALINSAFIIVLGCLFYAVFQEQYRDIALIALVFFLGEGITLAVSKLGTYALIPLSREFAEAEAQSTSTFSTLANMLYHGFDRRGYDLHMLFFCVGGSLWYYLLLVSGAVPQALAIWGLAAILLLTIPVLMVLYNRDLNSLIFLGIFYLPFEVVLGIWLLVKGFQ